MHKIDNKRKKTLRRLLFLQAFIEFVRPQDILPVIGLLKPGFLLLLFTIYLSIPSYKNIIKSEYVLRLCLAFLFLVSLSVFWSVNTRYAFNNSLGLALMLFGFVLPFVYSFDSFKDIKKFVDYYIFYLSLASLFVITHGGKGPGGSLGDENDAGLALAMAIPFAGFNMMAEKDKVKKIIYLLCMLVMILGVVASASRGALLSLLAAILGMALLSESKFKILLFLVISGSAVLPFIPDSYYKDMGTISDTKDETRKDRILGWEKSIRMFEDNKWFGVGSGNWGWVISKYETYEDIVKYRSHAGRAAHSIYFTVFPELGILGGGIYFLIILNLLRTYFHRYRNSSALLIRNSAIISIGVFLVGGVFLSVLYYPFLWYVLAMIVALDRIQKYDSKISDR